MLALFKLAFLYTFYMLCYWLAWLTALAAAVCLSFNSLALSYGSCTQEEEDDRITQGVKWINSPPFPTLV